MQTASTGPRAGPVLDCQLCNGLDPEERRNEARRAESGGGVLVYLLRGSIELFDDTTAELAFVQHW